MPRVDQGIPVKRVVERASNKSGKTSLWPGLDADQKKKLTALSAESFQGMIDSINEERENRRQTVALLGKILDKLEEIRYGLVDNETGISNLLKQMKLTNRRLDELVDKRH